MRREGGGKVCGEGGGKKVCREGEGGGVVGRRVCEEVCFVVERALTW